MERTFRARGISSSPQIRIDRDRRFNGNTAEGSPMELATAKPCLPGMPVRIFRHGLSKRSGVIYA